VVGLSGQYSAGVSRKGQENGRAWAVSSASLGKSILIGTVIKKTAKKRVVDVIRRMAQGSLERANDLLEQTMGGKEVNTAFIERFNGTMRERLASLTRRCRHAVRRVGMRRPLGCGSLDVPTTFAGRTMS
jgi:hypothetical protein